MYRRNVDIAVEICTVTASNVLQLYYYFSFKYDFINCSVDAIRLFE